jgi:dienelactone hydrolase
MMRLLALALSILGAASSSRADPVEFPGEDGPLKSELLRPAGGGPFPAVVALHGCGGLFGKGGALSRRHQDWADRLTQAGFMVLLPDSFGSRGLASQCRNSDRTVRPSRERVGDALAAASYLKTRPDVKRDAVNLLGWSNGGSTVLYALRTAAGSPEEQPFAKAVAFYPRRRVKDAIEQVMGFLAR